MLMNIMIIISDLKNKWHFQDRNYAESHWSMCCILSIKDKYSQNWICKQMLTRKSMYIHAQLPSLYVPTNALNLEIFFFQCLIWLNYVSLRSFQSWLCWLAFSRQNLLLFSMDCLPWNLPAEMRGGALMTPGQVFIVLHSSTLTFFFVLGTEFKNSQRQALCLTQGRENTVGVLNVENWKHSICMCILICLTILKIEFKQNKF